MTTGIGDAENLAWKLALVVRGRAAEALLDTYQAERRPLATEVLRDTTANTRILVGERLATRLLRDLVFIPLLNLPAVQRRAAAAASRLFVSYKRGPLGGGSRLRGKPRPGDRVADMDCRRADGSRTRLHAEFGGRWVLVVPAGGAHACEAVTRKLLEEYVVTLTRADQQSGAILLVRPDAHLAWRGRPDAAGLERWLQDALQYGQTRR